MKNLFLFIILLSFKLKAQYILGSDWKPQMVTVSYTSTFAGVTNTYQDDKATLAPHLADPSIFTVKFNDSRGIERFFEVSRDSFSSDLEKYAKSEFRWQIQRSTGASSAGKLLGIDFKYDLNTKQVETSFSFTIKEYLRDQNNGLRGEPVKKDSVGYQLMNVRKHRATPEKQFSWELPGDLKEQRFVMDFGGDSLVPILVLGYQNGKAIFTTVDFIGKVEKAGAGSELPILTYEVEAGLLRIATTTFYNSAASIYIDDRAHLSPEQIVKADRKQPSRFSPSEITIDVGHSLDDTLTRAQLAHLKKKGVLGSSPTNLSFCDKLGAKLRGNFKPSD